jgi:hypothetical protein
MMHTLAQQMSMTPLSSTTGTGTSDSGVTPSDIEAGTAGGNSSEGALERDRERELHKDRDKDKDRRSRREEGSAASTLPSFSTQDITGSTGGRFERRRRKRRSTSTATEDEPPGPMSYVVVDNDFESFVPDQGTADEKHIGGDNDIFDRHSIADCDINSQYTSYLNSDSSSRRRMKRPWTVARVLEMWNYNVWLPTCHFINSKFPDPKVEKAFKKEVSVEG